MPSRHVRRLGLTAATVAVVAALAPATAIADPTFGVMNASGGIYWRSAPDWNAAEAVAGNGFYPTTTIAVHCYQNGAGNVPGSADTMWEQASVAGGPGTGSGWINEHFINDGSAINQPSPGVPPCGAPSPVPAPTPPPPAPSPPTAKMVFTVYNAGGGIYYRRSPHQSDTAQTAGVGIYNGDRVQLICGQAGGPGPNGNVAWSYVSNLSRPTIGKGWVNEHFINDGAAFNALPAGEQTPCPPDIPGSGSPTPPPGSGTTPNAFYNRSAAVAWALAHAYDLQAYGAMCTWFVSRALWAGGFPRSATWTDAGRYGSAPGSRTAWWLPDFLNYVQANFSTSLTNITSNLHTNAVPQAEIGDLIVYDWGQGEGISHASIVVSFASGQYPQVSEMGQYDFDYPHAAANKIVHVRSRYDRRGWTWSAVHGVYLQQRRPAMKAYLLHINGGSILPQF